MNKTKLFDAIHWEIFDSGMTEKFLVEGTLVVNKHVAITQVTITLPNGRIIKSTHT